MCRMLSLPTSRTAPLDLGPSLSLVFVPLLLFGELSDVGVGGECSILGLFAPSRAALSCDSSDWSRQYVRIFKRRYLDVGLVYGGLGGGVSKCGVYRDRLAEDLLMAFWTRGGSSR